MRAAVPERDAEALRRADGDVRAKLRGRVSDVSARRSVATASFAPAAAAFSAKGL